MKKLILSSFAVAMLASGSSVLAQDRTFTKGSVKSIGADAGKVTIIHEELVNLDVPAMTMVFRADAEMLARLRTSSS